FQSYRLIRIGSNPTVVLSLSCPGAPLIVPPPRHRLMSVPPLGPVQDFVLGENPYPHQPPHQAPYLGHGQRQKVHEAVALGVSPFLFAARWPAFALAPQ